MNVIKPAGKKAADIAKRAARQVMEEPVEIVKSGKTQIVGEVSPPVENKAHEASQKNISPEEEARIKAQGKRQLQELESQIKDIREARVKAELERRAPPPEEKEKEPSKTLVEPTSKRPRIFGWNLKKKQLQTQAETRQPPTG